MQSPNEKLISLICLLSIAIALSIASSGILTSQQNIQTRVYVLGEISITGNIAVYSNPEATINCATLDCGNINQDKTATETIYIKNTGNISETLKMITINSDPLLARFPLTLTWNQEGTILEPGSIVPATLNFIVVSNIESFSEMHFNVVIAGIT
jgi:hypothetical protein